MAAPKLRVHALLVTDPELFHGWAVAERKVDGVDYIIETIGMYASDVSDAMNALTREAFDALVDDAVAKRASAAKGGAT